MDTFAIDEPMVTFGRNAARVWALSLGTTASRALFFPLRRQTFRASCLPNPA